MSTATVTPGRVGAGLSPFPPAQMKSFPGETEEDI